MPTVGPERPHWRPQCHGREPVAQPSPPTPRWCCSGPHIGRRAGTDHSRQPGQNGKTPPPEANCAFQNTRRLRGNLHTRHSGSDLETVLGSESVLGDRGGVGAPAGPGAGAAVRCGLGPAATAPSWVAPGRRPQQAGCSSVRAARNSSPRGAAAAASSCGSSRG